MSTRHVCISGERSRHTSQGTFLASSAAETGYRVRFTAVTVTHTRDTLEGQAKVREATQRDTKDTERYQPGDKVLLSTRNLDLE